MKIVYGLGVTVREGSGHGDPGGACLGIIKAGPYMTGGYPPLFLNRKDAEAYVEQLPKYTHYEVIELELWNGLHGGDVPSEDV